MVSRNQKNFEFKLGKQGLLLLVTGMSFFLFAVFVVGVMVGVHIDAYPEKIARSVPEIIRRQLQRPVTTEDKMATAGEETKVPQASEENNVAGLAPDDLALKPDLSPEVPGAEERKVPPPSLIANQAQAEKEPHDGAAMGAGATVQAFPSTLPAGNSQLSAAHPPDAMVTKSSATTPAVGKEPGSFAHPPDAKGIKPLVTTPPAGKDAASGALSPSGSEDMAAAPLPRAGGEYIVQAGSFQSRNKAMQFGKKITPLGYQPQVEMVDLPKKGKWFRVVVVGFASRDEARKAAGILSKKIKGVNCVVRPVK